MPHCVPGPDSSYTPGEFHFPYPKSGGGEVDAIIKFRSDPSNYDIRTPEERAADNLREAAISDSATYCKVTDKVSKFFQMLRSQKSNYGDYIEITVPGGTTLEDIEKMFNLPENTIERPMFNMPSDSTHTETIYLSDLTKATGLSRQEILKIFEENNPDNIQKKTI